MLKQSWFRRGGMVFLSSVVAMVLTVTQVDAKRLGGGKSFGRQSSSVTQRQFAPPVQRAQPAQATPSPTAAQPARNRWLGPLTGLAAGLGIAALLSHVGLGAGMANFLTIVLLVGAAIFVLTWVLRRFSKPTPPMPGYQPAYSTTLMGRETETVPPPSQIGESYVTARSTLPPASQISASQAFIPADFDVENFVRNAKVSFLRLQAAFDSANVDDLREFTSPEMFAELRLELQERGDQKQRTDVVTLNAELLSVETHLPESLASIRFSALLRETPEQPVTAVDEVWNFARPLDGSSGWVLAGIQQLN